MRGCLGGKEPTTGFVAYSAVFVHVEGTRVSDYVLGLYLKIQVPRLVVLVPADEGVVSAQPTRLPVLVQCFERPGHGYGLDPAVCPSAKPAGNGPIDTQTARMLPTRDDLSVLTVGRVQRPERTPPADNCAIRTHPTAKTTRTYYSAAGGANISPSPGDIDKTPLRGVQLPTGIVTPTCHCPVETKPTRMHPTSANSFEPSSGSIPLTRTVVPPTCHGPVNAEPTRPEIGDCDVGVIPGRWLGCPPAVIGTPASDGTIRPQPAPEGFAAGNVGERPTTGNDMMPIMGRRVGTVDGPVDAYPAGSPATHLPVTVPIPAGFRRTRAVRLSAGNRLISSQSTHPPVIARPNRLFGNEWGVGDLSGGSESTRNDGGSSIIGCW